jgi:hypothetical protein
MVLSAAIKPGCELIFESTGLGLEPVVASGQRLLSQARPRFAF